MAARAAHCLRPQLITTATVWQLSRPLSSTVRATRHVGCAPRRGIASETVPGIKSFKPPDYAIVPTLKEDPSAALDEMPELVLSGPRVGKSSGAESAASAQARKAYGMVPLEEAIRDASPMPALASASDALPEARFGQLENGVRIVSVDRNGLCSSLGLFIHAGSRYEKAGDSCMPHFLELMAFRSSAHLNNLRTLKTLEQLGASASCRVGREDILYQFDVLREYVPVALPLMLANVLCPSLLPEEVRAAHEHVLEVRHSLEENVESLLCELVHTTGYAGNSLGNPLYSDEQDLPKFTPENLRAYLANECTPDRIFVVGVNVDFGELCKWTARGFAEHASLQSVAPTSLAPAPPPRPMAPAMYSGGDFRLERENPLCHLMLGFEVPGGWNGPHLSAVTVLQMFLGGGGSFSTGGPGKGMHTRLYTEVLNLHQFVESVQASSVMYADSGLFTIYATVMPEHAGDFVKVLSRIFQGVIKRITPEELQRAKNALKSSIHMNLEMRAVMMEDLGRQLVLSGKVGTAQQFGRMVDAVTVDDLKSVLRLCLQTNPTVIAYGAVDRVPSHADIKRAMLDVAKSST